MSGTTPLDFQRDSLRGATQRVEAEYAEIDPRWFYRTAKRRLEEIQAGRRFKYRTRGTHRRDLQLDWHAPGANTGRVTGRLTAVSSPTRLGYGTIEYRPYLLHGAVFGLTGILLLAFGLTSDPLLTLIGIVAILGGIALLLHTESGSFPVIREAVIRVHLRGQVTGDSATDLFANVSVAFAADLFLEVDADAVQDLDWHLRRNLSGQVDEWYNRLVVEDKRAEGSTTLLGDLWASATGDRERARRSIFSRQRAIKSDFVMRRRYTSLVEDSLPKEFHSEFENQCERLGEELHSVVDDMATAVARENVSV